jgi:hypothetical protein
LPSGWRALTRAALGARPGSCRVSVQVVGDHCLCSNLAAPPTCLDLPGRESPYASSCLAPGERGEHATPTIPTGGTFSSFLRRQSPFVTLPRPWGPIRPLTATQRCGAESPFFGGCESRVCSSGRFTSAGLVGSVRASRATTQVSDLAPAPGAAGESARQRSPR